MTCNDGQNKKFLGRKGRKGAKNAKQFFKQGTRIIITL